MKKTLHIMVALLLVAGFVLAGCTPSTPTPSAAPTSTGGSASPAPTSTGGQSPAAPAPTSTGGSTPLAPAIPSAQETLPDEGPKHGGTFIVGNNNGPSGAGTINTPGWSPGLTHHVMPAVETLVGMSPEGPVPTRLATGWTIAPDGSSITFELRKGVKFHDGEDFNAAAVVWNLEARQGWRPELANIERFETPDDYTVICYLKQYSNTLLYHLTWYSGLMLSPKTHDPDRGEEWLNTNLAGTGPFKLVDFQRDTRLVYERFDGYWDAPKPYLDRLEKVIIRDTSTLRSALLTGEIDAWNTAPTLEASELRDQGYGINLCPGLMRVWIPDSANPDSPFFDPKVRMALDYALDKEAITEALGGGLFYTPESVVAPTHVGYDTPITPRSYDPDKARQLLAEAGYPNGLDMTVTTQPATNPDLLAAMQAYLLEVGINMEINVVENAVMATYRSGGWENGAILQGLSTATQSYVHALETDGLAPNRTRSALITPEYTGKLAEAARAMKFDDELRLTRELIKLIHDEAIILPLMTESRICVYAEHVHDFDLSGFSIWWWSPADIWLSK